MPMEKVSISSIDLSDELCRFGASSIDEHLKKFFSEHGQLNPVVLVSKGTRYRIIDGWKRVVFVAKKLAGKSIEARVVDSIRDYKKDQIILSYFLNYYRIGDLEKAEILFRLAECGELSVQEIVKDYLPKLSINPSYHNFRKYKKIAELDNYIKELFYSGYLSFGHLEILSEIDDKKAIDAIVRLILVPYKLNVNESRDVINGIRDVASKSNKSLVQAVEYVSKKMKEEKGFSNNKNALRSCIKRLRYPRLTYLEERFSSIVKSLSVPKSVTLRTHPYFENNHLEMIISFESDKELLKAMQEVQGVLEKGKFEEVLRLLKEGV